MDRNTGCVKVDAPPTKVGTIILDKLEHLIVRANNLTSTAAGLSTFMLGPKPEKPSADAPTKSTGSYADEVLTRLNELGRIIGEGQDHLEDLRSQFSQ